jgi:general L-amino acid transport system substrate-binding protein
MYKRLTLIICMLWIASFAAAQEDAQVGAVTAAILERGALRCGVNAADGSYEGFDVDFCRAVAAAVLGDAEAVEYVPLLPDERQQAIIDGNIDLLSRNTTMTLSRDTNWNVTFAPVTFYDGQGVMVFADSGIRTLQDLAGSVICAQTGTTTELNMRDAMEQRNLAYELTLYDGQESVREAFFNGTCDALTTDRSALAALRSQYDDPDALEILDIILSKEPLAPLSPQSDPQFADVVRWTIYGMIQAEEFGITSENLDDFLTSENPFVQRLLGLNDTPSGSYLGVPNDFMVAVLRQVGNYGEVYERWLGEDTPLGLRREGSPNDLWTRGGLMYAPPFR